MLQRRVIVEPGGNEGQALLSKPKPVVLVDDEGMHGAHWLFPGGGRPLHLRGCNWLTRGAKTGHARKRQSGGTRSATLTAPSATGQGMSTPLFAVPVCATLAPAGHASYTTLRKQALVTDLRLRHRDIRALDPGVALPCEHLSPSSPFSCSPNLLARLHPVS